MRSVLHRRGGAAPLLLLLLALVAAAVMADSGAPPASGECPALVAPRHGSVKVRAPRKAGEAALARFRCALGRQLQGFPTARCLRSGQWSHPAPVCASVGVRAYPDRAGLANVGVVEADGEALLAALTDAAQRRHGSVGFMMHNKAGAKRVWLLSDMGNATLTEDASADTYLFTRGGVLKRHAGRAARASSREHAVEFATDAAVLKGLTRIARQRRAEDSSVVGFSVAQGPVFEVALLGWASLPLRESAKHHAFVLRDEVEDKIAEVGCTKANSKGRAPLKAVSAMPLGTSHKSARLVCAALARGKGHRFMAVAGDNCYSGNGVVDRFGTAPLATTAVAAKATCLIPAARALSLKPRLTPAEAKKAVGAGAAKGFFHAFELHRSLLPVPDLFNGGFESPDVLSPALASEGAEAGSKQSVVLAAGSKSLTDWTVDPAGGQVGLATWGSAQLANHTVPEGQNVLYFSGGGRVSQRLIGLKPGARYTLRFQESFSRAQAPGMSLRVQVGDAHTVYQNPYVSVPLWSSRSVHFRATASSMLLAYEASSGQLPRDAKGARPAATLLLDNVRLARYTGIARVREGFVGQPNHGRVAEIDASAPELLAALGAVARRTAKKGNGGVGFRVVDNVVSALGVKDLATLQAHKGARLVLNNGTTLTGYTTATHSGHMSLREPRVLRTLRRMAAAVANSVGFSVVSDARKGAKAHVLSESALPLKADEAYATYLFDDGVADLGCWAQPQGTGNVLKTLHPALRQGPISKAACAQAAARAGHAFFALQGGNQCVSGHNDPKDAADTLYFSAGRSAACSVRCAGDAADVCGGPGAAVVFRLPLYSRVSKRGFVRLDPRAMRITREMSDQARSVFDAPGVVTLITANAADLQRARDASEDAAALATGGKPQPAPKVAPWAHTLQYRFTGRQHYAVTRYTLQAPTMTVDHDLTPSAWTFEGSADGEQWTVLDRQSRVAFGTGQRRSFTLRHRHAFHFHRFVFTDNSGAGVSGVGLQGVQLEARRDRVRFLAALYRFEDADQPGLDSSAEENDLKVFGPAAAGNDASAVFAVSQAEGEQAQGRGGLRISNRAGSAPSYMAVSEGLRLPEGFPVRGRSFGVAFWFKVNSTEMAAHLGAAGAAPEGRPAAGFGVLAWGDADSDKPRAARANRISLDRDFKAVRNSFVGARAAGAAARGLASPAASLLDAWHHYAVSYDQVTGAHRVWVDGKLAASRLYQNPAFSVSPKRFVLGLSQLPAAASGNRSGSGSDEFNGWLDDVAVFSGPLTSRAVESILSGNFRSYLPSTCQDLSDEFGIESGVTWGRATPAVKEQYMRMRCYTKPTDCQTLSDQWNLNPAAVAAGRGGFYERRQYRRQRCATWPAVLSKRNTWGSCAAGGSTRRFGVHTLQYAHALCHSMGVDRCRAFVWGGRKGDAASGMRPYEMRACASYLSDLRYADGLQIVTRVDKYLLHPNAKVDCNSHSLPTHDRVPSSLHARWLCDATPGCTAYVWTGDVGAHADSSALTPHRAVLCASISRGAIYRFPNSGYEVGEKLQAYITLPERSADCSPVAALAIVNGTRSSMAARRECDFMDGRDGRPLCASYLWDAERSETRLCGSVPQGAVRYWPGRELGYVQPRTCQLISDAFGVDYGTSWGAAPFELKRLFQARGCETSPSSCQTLSDKFQLSPDMDAETAAKAPGWVRDAWLRQSCKTRLPVNSTPYLVSVSFEDLQTQVDALSAKAAALAAKLARPNPALTHMDRATLREQLALVHASLQTKLDLLKAHQARELAPLLARAANSSQTLYQDRVIHDIAQGLWKNSLPNRT